jgi:hypothetical protein
MVTVWTLTREVLGSNLGRDTVHRDWICAWFASVIPGKCRGKYLDKVTIASFLILSSSSGILQFDTKRHKINHKPQINKEIHFFQSLLDPCSNPWSSDMIPRVHDRHFSPL